MVAWLAEKRGKYDVDIEEQYTPEQVALLFYLGKRDKFKDDERNAELTAAHTSKIMAETLHAMFS